MCNPFKTVQLSLYFIIVFFTVKVLTSLFSSFSSKPMFMESKDLPLRGPSFLLEYMFKCRRLCLSEQFSLGRLSLRKVGCLPRGAARFAI